LQGNGVGAVLLFGLGVGATLSGPAGAWASGDFRSANGAVSLVSTNSVGLNFAGVKLEVGSVATPFNRQSMAKSLADCQRYYCTKNALSMMTSMNGSANFGCPIALPVTMRANPTIVLSGQSYANASGLTTTNIVVDGLVLYAVATAAGGAQWSGSLTATAEL